MLAESVEVGDSGRESPDSFELQPITAATSVTTIETEAPEATVAEEYL